MPHEGKITLTLDFWSDGSLYASGLELVEVLLIDVLGNSAVGFENEAGKQLHRRRRE